MKTIEQLENMAEQFALSQHLTEWDDTLTYNEVLDILNSDDGWWDDERVLVWETYADWDGASISNAIENMARHTLDLLKEVTA